jgi:hypothetical protein
VGDAGVTTLRARALDADPFATDVLAALVAAIEVNDLVDREASLPVSVTRDYPAEQFVECFRLSRQLWKEGFDRRGLIALAAGLRRGEALDEEARRWFKQVRARFKHLRFAFFLYSAEHRSPPMLSLVTLVMGELQDAVRVKGMREVRRQATRLQLLLAPPGAQYLARETGRLTPSVSDGFRRFVEGEVASLRPLLAARETGAHAFHAARKVVSRQVSFHDDMRTLYPSDEHRAMARWLATLNGLMGQAHDDLVARNAAGAFRYGRDAFVLPEEIRVRLEALVRLYLGTSNSKPPSA